jgi:hypothetical protein
VRRVLGLVSARLLHRFVANMLSENPSAGDAVVDAASDEVLQLDRIVAYLHGLRLADFYELAKLWKDISDRHEVPASSQPVLFQFAATGLTFPDSFPEQLRAARDEMTSATATSRGAELAGRVGYSVLAGLLTSTEHLRDAARLLSTLEGLGPALTTEVRSAVTDRCPLLEALRAADIDELANCLSAARTCDQQLAETLVDSIGGEAEMLRRLRVDNPWVTELGVHVEEDTPIAYCRLLHVSDELQGDPRDQAVRFGRLLLRCLPWIESVDVQALLPGGHELRFGDYTHGVSGLRRQYDHSTLSVAWNQARLRAALTLLGETDTVRLSEALPLLDEAGKITLDIGNALVVGRAADADVRALEQRVAQLHNRARSLRPPIGRVEIGDTAIAEEAPVPIADDLSALITDLTGNVFSRLSSPGEYRALASYLAETVIDRHLHGTIRQPWHLLGMQGHPESLNRMSEVLHDLHAVVNELASNGTDPATIGRSARAGSRAQSLHRAAETCRQAARRRRQARRDALERMCRATGLGTRVLIPPRAAPPTTTTTFAITVRLASLLEWPEAASKLQEALSAEQPLGETYMFIPLRGGRPVPSMAIKLISTAWPATDIGEWKSQLAEPHSSHLADTFTKAQTALQALSGICHLPADQQAHELVVAAASAAASDLEHARDHLVEAPSDPLTNELLAIVDALAVEVQAEIDGTSSRPSVAEQVAVGALQGGGDDVFNTIMGARYLALEWDIDAARAVEMYESLS